MHAHSQTCNTEMDAVLAELRALVESVKDPLVDDWDPLRLGLLIAKLEYPELDLAHQERIFAQMVTEVTPEVPRVASLREQTKGLIHAYANKLGFQGDKQNYYNIKNSFVNDVMLRRKGIPIS